MYKAVFIDLDGTLIKKDHSVSDATINIIQQLKTKNILIVLVSARPLSGMQSIAEKVGLLTNPLASLNGAYIAEEEKIIFDSMIDANILKDLLAPVEKYDSTIIYYQQDKWFSQIKNYYTDYEQRITNIPVTIQPFELTLQAWQKDSTGPNKILIVSGEKETIELQEKLRYSFSQQVNISTSKTIYLELMNGKASKLNAVKFFMKRYKIKQEETIAIGDNFNDKDMIEFAGFGVAMGNAPGDIKAVANYVTDTNNNDGVTKALIKIFNL